MSDHSSRGYRKGRIFFASVLRRFSVISVQTQADRERFLSVAPDTNVVVSGNMKFDQAPPEHIEDPCLSGYFGEADHTVLLGASTHPGEEEFIARVYKSLKSEFASLKLVLIPRHAERGADVAASLEKAGLSHVRRSQFAKSEKEVDVLLADTTGEMFKFINTSDIVIMGKSLAGHDEGHNLIEPALLDKPVVSGSVLRNFRFIQQVLQEADALVSVSSEEELLAELRKLISDPDLRRAVGKRGGDAIRQHRGAMDRTIDLLKQLENN